VPDLQDSRCSRCIGNDGLVIAEIGKFVHGRNFKCTEGGIRGDTGFILPAIWKKIILLLESLTSLKKEATMLEHVHNHITKELEQNTKTDIIFILSAIVLNMITLGINSGLAEKSRTENSTLIVMFVFVTLIVLVNIVVIIGLLKGRQTRTKLINGLLAMYKDQNVSKYYDESLLGNYNVRYNLFIMVVVCTGVIAAIVPFISR
jgi:hypothetical protein